MAAVSLLLVAQQREAAEAPDFGAEFATRLARKTNPALRRASLSAWRLLALGLQMLGYTVFPEVAYLEGGKPYFPHAPLHFSLSHSGNLAAALISDAPCGVDVELIRPHISERLRARCLSPREAGLDFFECWTKKECIGKQSRRGMSAHPADTDTLDERWARRFLFERISDGDGQTYALAALCEDARHIHITWSDLT